MVNKDKNNNSSNYLVFGRWPIAADKNANLCILSLFAIEELLSAPFVGLYWKFGILAVIELRSLAN